MKRYEGLFILNTMGREEGVKDMVDKISAEISRLGGNVETVQKMDRRPFSRVTKKSNTSGFYVNIIFQLNPDSVSQLRKVFSLSEDVYRVTFTMAPPAKAEVVAVAAV